MMVVEENKAGGCYASHERERDKIITGVLR